jgi:hypothetical protein
VIPPPPTKPNQTSNCLGSLSASTGFFQGPCPTLLSYKAKVSA